MKNLKVVIRIALSTFFFILSFLLIRTWIEWMEWVEIAIIVAAIYLYTFALIGKWKDLSSLVKIRPVSIVFPVSILLILISVLLLTVQTQYFHIYWITGDDVFPSYKNGAYLAYSVIFSIFLAPIVEEVLFRRWLFQLFNKKLPSFASVFLVAVLFSIGHGDPLGAFIFSVVLSLVYLRYGTLVQCIWIHAVNNSLALLIGLLEDYRILPSLEHNIVPLLSQSPILVVTAILLSFLFLVYFIRLLLIKHSALS